MTVIHTINEIQISDNSIVCRWYIDVGECFDSSSIVWTLSLFHTYNQNRIRNLLSSILRNRTKFVVFCTIWLFVCVVLILNLFTWNAYAIDIIYFVGTQKRIRSISFINWMYFTLFYHSKSASLNLQQTIYRWLQLNEVKQNLLKYIEVQNIWIWLVYRMNEYCANRTKNDMMKSTSEFDFITHY